MAGERGREEGREGQGRWWRDRAGGAGPSRLQGKTWASPCPWEVGGLQIEGVRPEVEPQDMR